MSRSYRKYPFSSGMGDYRRILNRRLRHRNKQIIHVDMEAEPLLRADVDSGYGDIDWVVWIFESKGSGYHKPQSPEISLDRSTGLSYIEKTIEENQIKWKRGMSK